MCYAFYRLPYDDAYTVVRSTRDPLVLDAPEAIGQQTGFVIAPFAVTADCPLLLIQPDSVSRHQLPAADGDKSAAPSETQPSLPGEAYQAAFRHFHDAVSEGWMQKLVLSRSKELACPGCEAEAETLFRRACQLYPRLMVMLLSTPQSGTWLIATPEVLLDGRDTAFHTIALAGTMPYAGGYARWSQKNLDEQQVVADYLHDRLAPLAAQLLADGPVTMRAGDLVHLRTDFRFRLHEGVTPGTVISRLHPTPAVCGFPRELAQAFIHEHEPGHRRYYSGFAGPVGLDGETHLYVSLRCACLHGDTATLYAGGGIMPGSQCASEWLETEYKMKTICDVLK